MDESVILGLKSRIHELQEGQKRAMDARNTLRNADGTPYQAGRKYRKKPVVVEAVQLTELTFIHTLEGTMQGNPGDWLITGVNGERYPCKNDIFQKTYEPVDG